MCATKRVTIKQIVAHGGVSTRSALRVVSSGATESSADRVHHLATGGGSLVGRYFNCLDGPTGIPYVRPSSSLLCINAWTANSRSGTLPTLTSIFESDDQMAQCAGVLGAFGGSSGRSPP
jgi:hypothetical protein